MKIVDNFEALNFLYTEYSKIWYNHIIGLNDNTALEFHRGLA